MAVKIRLKRMGKIRAPFYRVVVMDSRQKRDGRAIEEIGLYHPTEEPSRIEINSERAQYWLSVGAQPTEQVAALLKVTGDWAKFKGESEGSTLKTAEVKPSKQELFEKALAESENASVNDAPTPKKKKAEPAAEAAAEEKPAEEAAEAPAEEKAAEAEAPAGEATPEA
ncbi:SSU ribosomal protein S16P [Kytococcus aerolatus]|uniref:Small ribosomal subunit protein bS16 n=1 Tax=Kytococcus aerolatus TaxID=592308 RepID=A0A212U239_9MICO|nr:30S ribosomal protein S16 [Kytococcus aerolatus]SNC72184.1 SSU ribosomal protein S16P [Kytococcus aerolatus]